MDGADAIALPWHPLARCDLSAGITSVPASTSSQHPGRAWGYVTTSSHTAEKFDPSVSSSAVATHDRAIFFRRSPTPRASDPIRRSATAPEEMTSISATYAARRSAGAGDLTNGPRHPAASMQAPSFSNAADAFSSSAFSKSAPTNAHLAKPPMALTVLASKRSWRSARSSAVPSLWGIASGDPTRRFSEAWSKISACAKSRALARFASVGKTDSKAPSASLATVSSGSCAANHQDGARRLRCFPRPLPAPPATTAIAFADATLTASELSRWSLR
mmetsp:Transcript_14489/g.59123  ORF Transcript_14489/g.59123 Transcript_14489/m.59123 type:complete len:275 (+) Transcript_14489:1325-2149(+)